MSIKQGGNLIAGSGGGGISECGDIAGTLSNQTDLQDTLNAKANECDVVKLTGNQTISETKTFSSSPIVPTPATADNSTKIATTAFVKAQGFLPSSSVKAYITETYVNGTSWYRIYSDGWCEQGGIWTGSNRNATATRNLLKNFSNSNYTCIIQPTTNQGNYGAHYVDSKTNSSVTISTHNASPIIWYACGY